VKKCRSFQWQLPNTTELSPSSEANRPSATKTIPPHLMEPDSSLSHAHKLATYPYPETDQSNPYPPFHFFKAHFNIILPSRPGCSKYSLTRRFPHQNPLCTAHLPCATSPAHLILLENLIMLVIKNTQQFPFSQYCFFPFPPLWPT